MARPNRSLGIVDCVAWSYGRDLELAVKGTKLQENDGPLIGPFGTDTGLCRSCGLRMGGNPCSGKLATTSVPPYCTVAP